MSDESAGPEDPAALLFRAVDITADVKHDLNNLVMGILGHAVLLRARPELSDGARQKAELIEQQALRMRDRIADLDAVRSLLEK